MRSQSAIATRAVVVRVASISKSTHGITKSEPTVPLTSPISGVATRLSWVDPPPDRPAASKNCASAATPDQEEAVGPPGSAQPVITDRAPFSEPDCNAAWSIAAICAIAPAEVCG
jgi:hypothetical protein